MEREMNPVRSGFRMSQALETFPGTVEPNRSHSSEVNTDVWNHKTPHLDYRKSDTNIAEIVLPCQAWYEKPASPTTEYEFDLFVVLQHFDRRRGQAPP